MFPIPWVRWKRSVTFSEMALVYGVCTVRRRNQCKVPFRFNATVDVIFERGEEWKNPAQWRSISANPRAKRFG
jgi:hypothetical protein